MREIDCGQRSDEWFAVRLGIPSASKFDRIVTGKGDPSKQAQAYLYELAAERISRHAENGFTSAAMERGIELEEEARLVYAMLYESPVREVGFCLSDDGRYGCSPDGLVGEDGQVELKCPMGKTHVEYLMKGTLPTDYVQQVQGGLFVTGRDWCDFVSYYQGLPLFVLRIGPDQEFHEALRRELTAFCDRLDELCADLGRKQ